MATTPFLWRYRISRGCKEKTFFRWLCVSVRESTRAVAVFLFPQDWVQQPSVSCLLDFSYWPVSFNKTTDRQTKISNAACNNSSAPLIWLNKHESTVHIMAHPPMLCNVYCMLYNGTLLFCSAAPLLFPLWLSKQEFSTHPSEPAGWGQPNPCQIQWRGRRLSL